MKNNIRLATILSYVALVSGNIISLLYTPFMLATLGTGEYGIFTLVNTIISYIYLLDMGLGNAVVRYNSKFIAEKNESALQSINGKFLILYSFIAVVGIGIGVIFYFNFDAIFGKGLSLDEISKVKIMFLVALLNLAISFPLNVFNGIILANERFVYIKLLNLFRTIINPLIMIGVLLLGYRSIGMIVASTIFNISLGAVNVVYCFKKLKIKMTFKGFDKNLYIEIFRFSFYVFLSAIAYKIYWSTDQFILGMFIGSTSITVYSVGTQFNGYFTSFSNVISGMFLPRLTKLTVVNENSDELMNILVKVSRIQLYISSLILSAFIIFGYQFTIVWAGESYAYSYYIAIIVMVPQLFSIVQSLFATMLEAMNKHKVKSLIYLGVAIFNLVLTLYLVKSWGMIGCAVATAIGMLINAILNNLYYYYSIKLNMIYYWNKIGKLFIPIIAITLIGYLIINQINPNSYITLFLCGMGYMTVFFLVLWIFAFDSYEKNIIKRILKKINVKNRN